MMNSISIGAVGAAIIAGLVSIIGLIIGKEQKVSEFRQIWIDDLRKCLIVYIANVNAISDALRVKKSDEKFDNSTLLQSYQSLNEANIGISLRINANEKPAQELLKAMTEFEDLFKKNSDITPENIRNVEDKFIATSRELLKFEWKRVKRGEGTFIWTKRILSVLLSIMFLILLYFVFFGNSSTINHIKNKEIYFESGKIYKL